MTVARLVAQGRGLVDYGLDTLSECGADRIVCPTELANLLAVPGRQEYDSGPCFAALHSLDCLHV